MSKQDYRRPEQEPTKTVDGHHRDEVRYEHPAYGSISASRVQCGGQVLYGSDFKHNTYVAVRIHHADFTRNLNRDWHHAGREIVEVMLSEAQWATFVSSMNLGSGIPCTLDTVQGERMPSLPYRNEKQAANEDFDKKAKELHAKLAKVREDILPEIAGLSKAKQEKILAALRMAEQEVGSNMPFMAHCFGEHVEETVEKAKIEIEAHMMQRLVQAGLTALTNGELPLLLENKDEQ